MYFAVPERALQDSEPADAGITIFVRDCSVRTVIGVPELERRQPQTLSMDLDIELEVNGAARSDHIADTVDYAAVIAEIRECLAAKSYFLLERLAEFIAARILDEFGARRVTVQVAKVGILEDVGKVGVKITRARAAGGRAPLQATSG
jgi:dihydroneopterin aldolase